MLVRVQPTQLKGLEMFGSFKFRSKNCGISKRPCLYLNTGDWRSGSALPSHADGHWFKSDISHINTQRNMKILWKTYELDVNLVIENWKVTHQKQFLADALIWQL